MKTQCCFLKKRKYTVFCTVIKYLQPLDLDVEGILFVGSLFYGVYYTVACS